jgi:hypothetical protein
VEACRGNGEFKLISSDCVVVESAMIINKAIDYGGAKLKGKKLYLLFLRSAKYLPLF